MDLYRVMATCNRIRTMLPRYASTVTSQKARTTVSNLIHPIGRRTARWPLLYPDRVGGDEIVMTHEELGVMISVRRYSITASLHLLQGEGLLKGYCGRLIVQHRRGLEEVAGATYGLCRRRISADRRTGARKSRLDCQRHLPPHCEGLDPTPAVRIRVNC